MRIFPWRSRLAGSLTLAVLCAGGSVAGAQSSQVTLTPALVEAGSPELIHVEAPPAAKLEGEWLGRKLEFFPARDGRGWFALAGVDVEAPVGPSQLKIQRAASSGCGLRDLSRAEEIHAAHYRTGALTVEPKFVSPGADALARIKEEVELKAKVFAASASEPLWSGSFREPVAAPATDSFGTRRMFNGKLASIHKGMDFRAPMGTPVRAGNSGVVVLARPLYYEGNCVVVDHGLGLFTISMHFSRIDVHEGERREALAVQLGAERGHWSRVTGPHLHWAVRWQGAYLDPAKLLRLDLNAARVSESALPAPRRVQRRSGAMPASSPRQPSLPGAPCKPGRQEPAQVPAVDVLVRRFAGGVVTAGQHARLKVEPVTLERLDHLQRILAWKGQIVIGVDEQDFLVRAARFRRRRTAGSSCTGLPLTRGRGRDPASARLLPGPASRAACFAPPRSRLQKRWTHD
jgi:hypothetical protein